MEIRQRIIDSCRELALKKGFRRLTVEEIATSARVTKGQFTVGLGAKMKYLQLV